MVREQQPNLSHLTTQHFGKYSDEQHKPLQDLVKPHIESFNFFAKEGLLRAVKSIRPVEFQAPNGQKISIFIRDATLFSPSVSIGNTFAHQSKVFPSECREGHGTYKGRLQVSFMYTIDGRLFGPEERVIGEIPIMVKSQVCNLHGLSTQQLIERGEEAQEMGGYFIVNGNEKLIRMLVMPRRNFPMCMVRNSWKNRGPAYTEFGVQIRCVTSDQNGVNNIIHFINNGTATMSFSYKKEQFFVPVVLILKALCDVTDQEIFTEVMKGQENNSYFKGCIANMLRLAQEEELSERHAILKYMGERFRVRMSIPEWYTDEEAMVQLLDDCVCIHLSTNREKFNLLTYMIRKLFIFAKGGCAPENADSPMFQEVLLGGHLYLMVLKEKLENWLYTIKISIERRIRSNASRPVSSDVIMFALKYGMDISKSMEYLMATGNLVSRTGLGLMQATGLTVVADKLNFYRYLSHFRSIHRGAFFAEMRTTTVRKLLPEAWGFLCPVHTPDGSPCGLLNHLSALCEVVNRTASSNFIAEVLLDQGMEPYDAAILTPLDGLYSVMLDGKMIGWIPDDKITEVVEYVRKLKVFGLKNISRTTEICLVPKTKVPSQYPGLYFFTGLSRMMRPVTNLAHNKTEMIGSFEQAYMNICITPDEAYPGITTHQELRQDAMLSVIASLTPFSDFNQSPRNMYQCQMGKQTMGTPLHAYPRRADNKLYRIQTPQAALVRPHLHDHYNIDEYPLGTNAVVCVISYTGYDMEDAMIINKSSYERGFAHGSIYKSEFIDLKTLYGDRRAQKIPLIFGAKPGDPLTDGKLELDGLPAIGTLLEAGTPYYSYINVQTGDVQVKVYKYDEPARVEQIKVLGGKNGTEEMQRVCMVLRVDRNPVIGDKFASRHGQKGICSQKWPTENMPFSESGMTPDIIFNPHGFPSRMTIGMMIESMAGKSAALQGHCYDATPFTFSEDTPAIDYFGKMLTKAGYNYYGTERMYSGVDGREFEADIFLGVVYYQRLRHMVSDKFQVRTTGPIDQLTHQPVHGRKRQGGVRFGEMERDALLAHGTSFLLEDRLFNCSDHSIGHVCAKCGSLLSPMMEKLQSSSSVLAYESQRSWMCTTCKTTDTVKSIAVPYVFRYLVAELAAMNINVALDVCNH